MELSNAKRGQVLVEALPYIQKYTNKIVVIKYGGNAMINEELKNAVMGDIALLAQIGVKVVLVHGGGPEISSMLTKIGKKSEFVNGLRVTDEETIDIVQMVLAGAQQALRNENHQALLCSSCLAQTSLTQVTNTSSAWERSSIDGKVGAMRMFESLGSTP